MLRSISAFDRSRQKRLRSPYLAGPPHSQGVVPGINERFGILLGVVADDQSDPLGGVDLLGVKRTEHSNHECQDDSHRTPLISIDCDAAHPKTALRHCECHATAARPAMTLIVRKKGRPTLPVRALTLPLAMVSADDPAQEIFNLANLPGASGGGCAPEHSHRATELPSWLPRWAPARADPSRPGL